MKGENGYGKEALFKKSGSSGFRVGSIPLLRLRGGRGSYGILAE